LKKNMDESSASLNRFEDTKGVFRSRKLMFVFVFLFVCLMVFIATFNNILVISWRSVLLVEETGEPGENHRCGKSLTNFIT
jgi:hypothetical protein